MDKWWKQFLITFGLLIFGFFILKYVLIYFSPFIIAIIIASLIDPVVSWLDSKIPLHRGFSVIIILTLIISIFIIITVFGFSQIYLELERLLRNLPDYSTLGNRTQWIFEQNNQIQELVEELDISPSIKNVINDNLKMIYEGLRRGLIDVINEILKLLTKLPLILTITFLSFIATFFVSRDKEKINKFILDLFPEDWRSKVKDVQNDLIKSAIGFIRAQLILITITGIITGIGLVLLGNQYAFILAVASAILDLIPIIGPALIFYPWILYNFISGNISMVISLLVLHLILAGVRSASEGKIMGKNIGIHPLSTMIALYVGFRIMGALGFIVGPGILIIIKALFHAGLIKLGEE